MKYAIGVDIGGTSIRCGLVNEKGHIYHGSLLTGKVNSKGAAEEILSAFSCKISNLLELARQDFPLVGLGIGMCGPLNYEEGISLIQGVDKYESLYGMNLKKELRSRLDLSEDFPVHFEPDSWTFARGEAWRGAGKGYRRIMVVTLGSGFGSAFVADGEVLSDGQGVPPPFGWIGGLPYEDGLLDDVISSRGIQRLYNNLSRRKTEKIPDVRIIVMRARAGKPHCCKVMEQFGEFLGNTLKPFLRDFRAECLVFGGRISKSFDLFESPMKRAWKDLADLKCVTVSTNGMHASIRGAARLVFQKESL